MDWSPTFARLAWKDVVYEYGAISWNQVGGVLPANQETDIPSRLHCYYSPLQVSLANLSRLTTGWHRLSALFTADTQAHSLFIITSMHPFICHF